MKIFSKHRSRLSVQRSRQSAYSKELLIIKNMLLVIHFAIVHFVKSETANRKFNAINYKDILIGISHEFHYQQTVFFLVCHSEKKRFLWFSTHIFHAIIYATHLLTHSISSIITRNDNNNYKAMKVNKELPKMFNKENLCFIKKAKNINPKTRLKRSRLELN